jgi:predicted O-methyltransferase YrrM
MREAPIERGVAQENNAMKSNFHWPLFTVLATACAASGSTAQETERQGSQESHDAPLIQSPPLAQNTAERRILDVLDDLDRHHRHRMNISPEDGRLLRVLTESINAKHVVEIGTFNGYSGLWLTLGLQATGGHLTTYEINAEWASEARENFARAGTDDLVTVVVGDAHRKVKDLETPIDLLFLDADKAGYVFYLRRLLPLVRPGGLIVAHNMVRPPPDPRYIKAITTNQNLETIFLNMGGAGIGVTLKKR